MSRLVDHVDPFIGVECPGRCLAGPYLPNSLVRLGPDMVEFQEPHGYWTGKPIRHFSHTHVSGTGGGGRYGNVGVRPFTGLFRAVLDGAVYTNETASAGYYSCRFTHDNILCELTSTPRTGVHRYTFPDGAPAHVMIDAGAVIQAENLEPGRGTGICLFSTVEWLNEREACGMGTFKSGFGHDFPYSVYFFARFDRPATDRRVANAQGWFPRLPALEGLGTRGIATFPDGGVVNLQVGISYVSIANARASVDREAAGRDFDAIRREAEATWEAALGRIRIDGTDAQRTMFHTMMTRLLCQPSDLGIDDEFPSWKSGVRHYTDYYCLWDSVRNANSLITLFDPDLEVAMLNCLLDIGDHTGWIPDAWIAGHSAYIQGGSSADVLLCEAWLKGLPGIDYERALRQMLKNNTVESPNPALYGRHLADYRDLGFVPVEATNGCVSRHMEYAYQDWCAATLAAGLGHDEEAARALQSSRKLWNLWRDDLKSFAPRNRRGEWIQPYDPTHSRHDWWFDPYFYEGKGVQWSFSTHHDFAGLIERHGGPEAFLRHLDWFFDNGFYYSKETMLHIPWLSVYAGRPDRTAERIRTLLAESFRPTRDGLVDNEDMGCQSAWYMLATMGFYPIMGQDLYLLSAPMVDRTEIEMGTSGNRLIIEAPGACEGAGHVQSASLNGEPLGRAWMRHGEIAQGGVLRFEMGHAPSSWGTNTPPPTPMRPETSQN